MSPIASDLSYECLQKRRRENQLSTPRLDQSLGLPQLFQQQPVIRFWDAGEGQLTFDAGDAAQISDAEPTPSWHFRGKR